MPTSSNNGQSSQQHDRQEQRQQAAHDEGEVRSRPDAQAAQQADALDAVLDDIETSLQNNAEEYVRSFVQKGGQ